MNAPMSSREVTKEQFYDVIYGRNPTGTGLNVHPFPERDLTTWYYLSGGHQTRRVFGYTNGYVSRGPDTFFLAGS